MSASAAAWCLGRDEPGWPERLEHLAAPPAQLWGWGRLPAAGMPAVAVVGSRRATPAGLAVARELGAALAEAGIVVVSGMARGIDAAAHQGALGAGGNTVAVLGCGIELCYPREHRRLRQDIIDRGAVVSEDGADAPPVPWRFPRRNRLIAALVEAVVVVEATAKSGALSTARWAADLGREVLAVPGSIRNPSAHGSNLLIRDGARPYLELRDLFDAVPSLRRAVPMPPARGVAVGPGGGRRGGAAGDPGAAGQPGDDPVLARVLQGLGSDPVHPDELAAVLGLPPAVLLAALTTLTVRGAVIDVWGGLVARTV